MKNFLKYFLIVMFCFFSGSCFLRRKNRCDDCPNFHNQRKTKQYELTKTVQTTNLLQIYEITNGFKL